MLDKKALDALTGTPGLEPAVKKFYKYGLEKIYKIQYTGSNIRVNNNNFKNVYNILIDVCKILDVSNIPDMYIEWNYSVNGFTTGVENPIIVLTSGSLDLLSDDELYYLIGHEVGHIKSGHVLYHTMASVVPIIGKYVGNLTLGLGEILSTGLQLALMTWYRKSEYTADRAGLLACQDMNVVVSAVMKMAGIPARYYGYVNQADFIQQAKDFDDFDFDKLDKVAKIISVMDNTHPWTVLRTAELTKWVDSGQYNTILNRIA